MLYFAYGSNLDQHNWKQWCAARGFEADSIEPLGPAWLPDHELAFRYPSRLRPGGALDIVERLGSAIPGAIFAVRDWAGLDAKEGVAGGYYRRVPVTALTADGRAHAAFTYRVCPDRLVEGFVAPAPEYHQSVTRGLSRFGHGHESFVSVARGERAVPMPNAIFTYGTLMRGQASHDLLTRGIRSALGPARVMGASLIHIDWYPGLILCEGGCVHGELYEVEDIGAMLAELDPYEDFAGYGEEGSLYRRSLVTAEMERGSRLAWTYVYLGDRTGCRPVAAGRWTGA